MNETACCDVCGCSISLWLPVRPVAARLCVSPQTMYNLIRDGQVQAVKMGGQWRIRHAGFDAYLQRREKSPRLPAAHTQLGIHAES